MDIHELGALDLARALKAGELSSRDIVMALFERADAVDGPVNALVHRFDEQALADEKDVILGPQRRVSRVGKEHRASDGKAARVSFIKKRVVVRQESVAVVERLT